jgi:hypothetical protein
MYQIVYVRQTGGEVTAILKAILLLRVSRKFMPIPKIQKKKNDS